MFVARFPGRCDDCRETITPGEEVQRLLDTLPAPEPHDSGREDER